MDERHDISTRADIDRLVSDFYAKVLPDPIIGYLFTSIAGTQLEKHLPIIADFWETVLLGAPSYARHGRSPMLVHLMLHQREPLTAGHFARWLELFHETVDTLFAGPVSELAKTRASGIAGFFQQEIKARDERSRP